MRHCNNDEKDGKYESESSDDDQFTEAIVTGGDGGRRRVCDFYPKATDIYHFIGQIYSTFDYWDEYKYKETKKGTGTVVYIGNADQSNIDRAYVLTCAHNIRHCVMFCVKCHKYREIKRKNIKTVCAVCGQRNGANQQKTIIKATKTIFVPRSIKSEDFGKALNKRDYVCKEIYVCDEKYTKYWKPKDGFDWAFIAFKDYDCVYANMNDIKIEFLNSLSVFNDNHSMQKKEFGIFGYPRDKDDKMWGMKYKTKAKNQRFEIRTNESTKQSYIRQTGIDTISGESGALLWFVHNGIYHICGIHCGGSKGGTKNELYPYNIATVVGTEIIDKFNQIKQNSKVEFRFF